MLSSWRNRCAHLLHNARTTAESIRRRRSALSLRLETLEDRTVPSTFAVTTDADSGAGSLRQAILNANAHHGADQIVFNLPSGQNTINLLSALPTITGAVTIDGTTQRGYQGTPVVELNGNYAGAANGLTITAANVTVKGLLIDSFEGDGILIQGSSATGDHVLSSRIFNNGLDGVQIVNASGNVLGGNQAGQGNSIAGNGSDGVGISGSGSTGNRLLGNWIGVLSDGSMAGNFANGVNISGGASGNVLRGNTVVGNGSSGIWIHDAGTNNNNLVGNYVGTDTVSSTWMGNGLNGVTISGGASSNTLRGNVISENSGAGVSLTDAGTTGNHLTANFIGTDNTGTVALGNYGNGVEMVSGANGNFIGGGSARAGNVIANNGGYGVSVDGASQETILSNSIFANGAGAIGYFDGANNNQPAPTLTSLVVSGSRATLQGNVGTPNTQVLVQIFKEGPNGPVLVASRWVLSDASGNVTVHLRNVSSTDVLTATVTVGQNTSMPSNEVTVNGPVNPPSPPPPPGGIIAA